MRRAAIPFVFPMEHVRTDRVVRETSETQAQSLPMGYDWDTIGKAIGKQSIGLNNVPMEDPDDYNRNNNKYNRQFPKSGRAR